MQARGRLVLGWFTVACALGTQLFARAAHADTKSCVASHASAQREAKAGRLKLASQLYTTCGSDNECPEQLRTECAELLDKVRATIPTVIFSVLDENGKDVSNVRVFSTDELITEGLNGLAIEMDPGKHRLRFLLPWGDVLSSDVLIREGEKNRLIQVKIEKPAAEPAAAKEPPKPQPEQAPPPVARKPPVAAWVMTGVAVAGAGAFTTFALLGNSQKQKIDACAPACDPTYKNTRNTLKTDYLLADISLGVAVVSTAVATYLFVSSSGHEQPVADAPRLKLQVGLSRAGGTLLLSRAFE